jgi:hypothetical protein
MSRLNVQVLQNNRGYPAADRVSLHLGKKVGEEARTTKRDTDENVGRPLSPCRMRTRFGR